MKAILSDSGDSGDFELPKAGVTIGRCFKIVDLGTHQYEWKGKPKLKHMMRMYFELPFRKMERNGEEVPMMVQKDYNLVFGTLAQLRIDVEMWYGKKFNERDVQNSGGFDPKKVLGRPAQITIEHSDDGKWANITALAPLLKADPESGIEHDQICPDQINPTVFFDLEEFDRDVYESLSEKVRLKIAQSPEGKQALGEGQGQQEAPKVDDDFDALDIPF